MPRERSAFTLIEILIAITMAVALSGLAMVGFNQMRQVSRKNQAMTDLALEASYIHRRMEEDLAICQQTSQMRFERVPSVADASYPAYALRVFFLGELPNRQPANGLDIPTNGSSEYPSPQVWLGWEWRPPSATTLSSVGSFSTGRTSPGQRTQVRRIGGTDYTFYQIAESRRSRKRSPDDDDYRLLPNATAALAAAGLTYGMVTGDYTDVFGEDRNGNSIFDAGEDANENGVLNKGQLAPLSLRMKSLELSWVDFAGNTTRLDATAGVSPTGSDAWWTQDLRVVDGLYRDGRIEATSVLGQRPAILRVRFVLMDPVTRLERAFSFSFCLGQEATASAGGL